MCHQIEVVFSICLCCLNLSSLSHCTHIHFQSIQMKWSCPNLDEGLDRLDVVLLHPPHRHLVQLQPHHVETGLWSSTHSVVQTPTSTPVHREPTNTGEKWMDKRRPLFIFIHIKSSYGRFDTKKACRQSDTVMPVFSQHWQFLLCNAVESTSSESVVVCRGITPTLATEQHRQMGLMEDLLHACVAPLLCLHNAQHCITIRTIPRATVES